MSRPNGKHDRERVGILGCGEIGSSITKICKEAGYEVLIRELKYDQIAGDRITYLHVNIPEKNNKQFINTIVKNIQETKPKLTIINSSTTPGTTRKIFLQTHLPIIHSPVIGVHPNLYESIKYLFPKIIGPVNKQSLDLAREHFRKLGVQILEYDRAEESEAAKLLDLVYYAWNIIFCKWVDSICKELGYNFAQVYTKHNQIYNAGYSKLLPHVIRPVLVPIPGPIGGHCTIPDTLLFHKFYMNLFTSFILSENKKYAKELKDSKKILGDEVSKAIPTFKIAA